MYVPLSENLLKEEKVSGAKSFPSKERRTLQVIYRLRENARVKIKLINPDGKVKREFDLGTIKPGMHTSKVDVSRIPPGIYLLKLLRGKSSKPVNQTVILY